MKKSITIGIPAYNEEASISGLLVDLLKQDFSKLSVKIIVASDASTDSTVAIAKSFNSKLISVIDRKVRGGKAEVMNQIKKLANSNVLVILDADTRIPDNLFIKKLTAPIFDQVADLTSADEKPFPPISWFEKMLAVSVAIKRDVFFNYKGGQNFYTCHGQARAFSQALYKKLKFPYSAGEDLYSYAYCKTNGFKYKFVCNTAINFKLPTNYRDHERQSIRFTQALNKISKEFSKEDINSFIKIPWPNVVFWTLVHLLKNPLFVTLNILVFGVARLRSLLINASQNTWVMVTSTKN